MTPLLVSLCVAGATFFGALALLPPRRDHPRSSRARPRARRAMVLRPRAGRAS